MIAAAAVLALSVVLLGARTVDRARDYSSWEALVRAQAEAHPRSAQARFDLGNLELSRRVWSGAITHYEEAVRLRPDFWMAWLNMGSAWFGRSEPGLAMRSFDAVVDGVRGKPAFAIVEARAEYHRALVLIQQNRNQEAVRSFQRMLQTFPDHLASHANLGFIYSNNENYSEQASYHLGRAMDLETDPERRKSLEEFIARVQRQRLREAKLPSDIPSGQQIEELPNP